MIKYVIFLLAIIFISPNYYALSKEQQDNISTYAKEMIEKGNARRASDGTPLLKYGSGETRIPAFKGELYRGHFVFNCDSFVSYVLYNTYGFPVMKGPYNPYVDINYAEGIHFNKAMYKVSKGDYNLIKKNLEKGDIVVCYYKNEVTHVFLYIGDGLIAQARSSGLFVDNFDWYSQYYKTYMVVRLREEGATKPVDMSITWPDTKEKEILGYDAIPTINIKYDNSKKYKENTMIIELEDDKEIDSYSISLNSKSLNWIKVNKIKDSINYIVKENGIYNIAVRDSKGHIETTSYEIANIDNIPPKIEKIEYKYNGNNTYNISVTATDESKIRYLLTNTFQSENVFINIAFGKYELIVEDELLNKVSYQINLLEEVLPIFKVNYDTNYAQKVDVSIIPDNISNVSYYAIGKALDDELNWLEYKENLHFEIDKNGLYYIWLMNKDNISYYNIANITNIDNTKPVINNHEIIKKGISDYDIKINASDNCELYYSKDNINYQKSNILTIPYEDTTIYIKDCANNTSILSIGKESNQMIIIIIIGIVLVFIIIIASLIYILKKKKQKNNLH